MTQWCRRTLLKRRKRTRSKKLRLSGVLLAESEVIRLMDEANLPYTLVKLLTKEGKVMAKDYLFSGIHEPADCLAVKNSGGPGRKNHL